MAHFEVLVLIAEDDQMTEADIRAKATSILAPFEVDWDSERPNQKWDRWRPADQSETAAMIGDYDPAADELNWEICPHCWGIGRLADTDPDESCTWCKGDGIRTKWRRISDDIVSVPIIRSDFDVAALITPQGEWMEPGRMLVKHQWRVQFQHTLKSYRDCLAVLVHCHC